MNLKFNFNLPAWALFLWAAFVLLDYGGNLFDITGLVMQMIAIGVLCFLTSGGNCRIQSMEEDNGKKES